MVAQAHELAALLVGPDEQGQATGRGVVQLLCQRRQALGIGRTPVREALQRLAREHVRYQVIIADLLATQGEGSPDIGELVAPAAAEQLRAVLDEPATARRLGEATHGSRRPDVMQVILGAALEMERPVLGATR